MRVAEVLRDLATEYRLAIRYAMEVLSEIEAVLLAEDRPALRALVTSMRGELDAHMALSYLIEEAAQGETSEARAALPEPPEEPILEPA
ncbi:hypothetical protein Pyrfu_0775 [Pyrolobus fumarii 1A]|uniref:Uncharacterized protein n=1 Tax=Pyrolobus fumarii (strain DSM 11204 / 1A) TaxID=694429 RepID=G0EDF9_PYRF1|nr:hypothetical protein Pyrfu_0775 [Pyrolobus fumarii 1A]